MASSGLLGPLPHCLWYLLFLSYVFQSQRSPASAACGTGFFFFFLTELVCGQGAEKSTSATRDKADMAFVLYTWGRELSMLYGCRFRSLEASPLRWEGPFWILPFPL